MLVRGFCAIGVFALLCLTFKSSNSQNPPRDSLYVTWTKLSSTKGGAGINIALDFSGGDFVNFHVLKMKDGEDKIPPIVLNKDTKYPPTIEYRYKDGKPQIKITGHHVDSVPEFTERNTIVVNSADFDGKIGGIKDPFGGAPAPYFIGVQDVRAGAKKGCQQQGLMGTFIDNANGKLQKVQLRVLDAKPTLGVYAESSEPRTITWDRNNHKAVPCWGKKLACNMDCE